MSRSRRRRWRRCPRRGAGRTALLAALGVGAWLAPGDVGAQIAGIDDPDTEYLRLLQIRGLAVPGSFTVLPLAGSPPAGATPPLDPWAARRQAGPDGDGEELLLRLLDARLRAVYNTDHPTGRNDGAVWQGRGLTSALDFGAELRWRGLRVQVAPTLAFNQNAAFDLAPVADSTLPVFAYPWRRIDLPQRFGPDAFWTLDPGQSEASVGWRALRAGFGTRNLWWGPGRRNAIVMSDNAAGSPHAFLGTDGPADIGIGSLEARWIWGRLGQSDYFEPGFVRDERFLTGLVLAYSPDFLDGLTVGVTRVFYGWVPDGGVPLGDYFMVLTGVTKSSLVSPSNPTGDDEQDQLLSLFFRWALERSGFEVYGEWARNDHAWDLADFFQEPEHSQAYTIGLQKAEPVRERHLLSLWAELTHLERSRTVDLRPSPVYYTHHIVTQGYTHEGQVVGAGVGPGGNSQQVGADLFAPWGRLGVFAQRDVHDNDAYYDWAEANDRGFCCNDVSLRLGGHGAYFLDRFDLGGSAVITRQLNRYFLDGHEWNLHVGVTATWRPR